MHIGFFDDSGKESDNNAPYVVLAGYLAEGELWASVMKAWKNLLMHHSLPSLHMKIVMSERFMRDRGWDWQKRQAVIGDFIRIIKNARLTGFGVAVDATWWREQPKERRQLFGDSQMLCFQRVLRMMSDRMDLVKSVDTVEAYFDNDIEFSGGRLKRFNGLRKDMPTVAQRFVAIGFGDAEYYEPLQAADLLAWHTRLALIRRNGGKNETPLYREMMTALSSGGLEGSYTGEFWYAETSEHLLREAEQAWQEELLRRSSS